MEDIFDRLNYDIGFYWWKRYIYCGFWKNISTPTNLSIMVFTALTTGQTATQSLISERTSTALGAAVLFISMFNTFFKPGEELASNLTDLKLWEKVGSELEIIHYRVCHTDKDKQKKLTDYVELFKKVSNMKRSNAFIHCIELLFYCIKPCIGKNIKWISGAADRSLMVNFNAPNPFMTDATAAADEAPIVVTTV